MKHLEGAFDGGVRVGDESLARDAFTEVDEGCSGVRVDSGKRIHQRKHEGSRAEVLGLQELG